jgi:hypothetical protein
MDPFFVTLGQGVLSRWKDRNFDPAAFPGIARALLEERPPFEHVDVSNLIREFLLDDAQPPQSQSGFGQPELVVFEDPRFYIQLLFWMDGSTDIHQHEFSGAFHVLEGSSIHSRFEFHDARSVSARLRVGNLKMVETELLETGRTVEIESGRGFIHALFHLDTPSITVVVRTQTDPGTGPQFTYLPPHIAVDPFFQDALTNRRKQLLDVLEAIGDPGYAGMVAEMLGELDFERGFFVLQNCVLALRAAGEWDSVWEVFAGRHGAVAGLALSTIEEILRRDALVALRGSVTEVEHRFFLALLLNVPDATQICRMVAERFPGPAEATLRRWVGELAESGVEDSGLVALALRGVGLVAV